MQKIMTLGSIAALALFGVSAAAAQTVTELYVTPDTIRLDVGGRKALAVQAFDDAGNAVLSFTFRSSDTTIALVASNGAVTAGRAGRASVTVQAGSKSQIVPVIVTGPAGAAPVAAATKPAATPPKPAAKPAATAKKGAARIAAEPASLTLFLGQVSTVAIRAFDAAGNSTELPPLSWRSVPAGLVSANAATGEVTALAAGTGVVQVSSGTDLFVNVPVTISAAEYRLGTDRLTLSPEQRQTVAATLPQEGNRPVPAGVLQWSVVDPGIASVDANGEVVALAPGQTEVLVRGFGAERRIAVVVHRKIAHFLMSPRFDQPVRLMPQATREFTAMPQTADSIPIEGVPTTWALSDSSVASFDAESGILKALKGGTTTLSFTVRGFQPKSWTVEVMPGDVQLANTHAAVRPGQQLQVAASFVDPRGNVVAPATGLAWTTADASVAKVSATGTLQGVAPGRTTITASAPGGKPVTMSVIVSGDLLVASSRGGSFGIYALVASAPEQFHAIVADSGNNIDPAYSPDRSKLVYASDRGGSYDLYVSDADGRNPVRLTTDPAPESEPAWSPDGRRIIFAATRAGSRQLYVVSSAGGEARQLTSLAGGASQPVVSPDGKTVAFTGALAAGRDPVTDIYTIPLGGGAPSQVTLTKDRRESEPAYLPDGTLVWLQLRKDKKDPDQIVQQPKIGGISATLFSTQLALQSFAVSPDGERLAWVANRAPESGKGAAEPTLQWRAVSGGNETTVRLQAGERITGPSF